MPTGRLRFPDESVRMVFSPGPNQGNFIANNIGINIKVFTDQAATSPADIQTWPGGVSIPNSVVQVGTDSLIPIFLGPNTGATVLWGQVVGGTGSFELLARSEDRLTTLETGQLVAAAGTATLAAGTVVVSTTAIQTTSKVYLSIQSVGGTPGFHSVSARSAGVSFTISSTSNTDTSTVAWAVI